MKLCKDCRWFMVANDTCRHDNAQRVDYVRGEVSFYSASTLRTSIVPGDCGKDAQYFQPKLSEAA